MTRDDIIRMAREAGCGWTRNGTEPLLAGEAQIEKFAELVAADWFQRGKAALIEAVESERERCAQLCEAYGMPDGTSETALALAAAIRGMKCSLPTNS